MVGLGPCQNIVFCFGPCWARGKIFIFTSGLARPRLLPCGPGRAHASRQSTGVHHKLLHNKLLAFLILSQKYLKTNHTAKTCNFNYLGRPFSQRGSTRNFLIFLKKLNYWYASFAQEKSLLLVVFHIKRHPAESICMFFANTICLCSPISQT